MSLAVLSYVFADCNADKSGVPWGNKTVITAPLPTVCRQLSGSYPPGSFANRCYNSEKPAITNKYRVRNVGNDTRRLTVKACVTGITKAIDCPYGGQFNVSGWLFKSVLLSNYFSNPLQVHTALPTVFLTCARDGYSVRLFSLRPQNQRSRQRRSLRKDSTIATLRYDAWDRLEDRLLCKV